MPLVINKAPQPKKPKIVAHVGDIRDKKLVPPPVPVDAWDTLNDMPAFLSRRLWVTANAN